MCWAAAVVCLSLSLSLNGVQAESERKTNKVSAWLCPVLIDLITDVTALLKPSQDQIAKITKLS